MLGDISRLYIILNVGGQGWQKPGQRNRAQAAATFFLSLSLSPSVSAIILAFACAMEAVSIITSDGIINIYIRTCGGVGRKMCLMSSFLFRGSPPMPASLEIQHERVCYGMKCYGRTGKLENTAGVFSHMASNSSYFRASRITGRCPWWKRVNYLIRVAN